MVASVSNRLIHRYSAMQRQENAAQNWSSNTTEGMGYTLLRFFNAAFLLNRLYWRLRPVLSVFCFSCQFSGLTNWRFKHWTVFKIKTCVFFFPSIQKSASTSVSRRVRVGHTCLCIAVWFWPFNTTISGLSANCSCKPCVIYTQQLLLPWVVILVYVHSANVDELLRGLCLKSCFNSPLRFRGDGISAIDGIMADGIVSHSWHH